MVGKFKDFHFTITFPVECSGFRPVLLVHAVRHGTFQYRTVSGIGAWQVVEFIQLVNSLEVDNQIQRNGVGTVFRMPVVT